MKFGHNLPKNQVPEWASAYIDYKGLKKQIKSVSESAQSGKDVDLAGNSSSARSHLPLGHTKGVYSLEAL